MIGKLVLTGTDTAKFPVNVSSETWPSRGLSFEPIKKGKSGMAAYREPVYNSRINVTLTNTGAEPFTFEYSGREQTLAAGETAPFPEMAFKDFGVIVIPKKNHQANIELGVKFDKAYRTSSWKLVAEWSDGP